MKSFNKKRPDSQYIRPLLTSFLSFSTIKFNCKKTLTFFHFKTAGACPPYGEISNIGLRFESAAICSGKIKSIGSRSSAEKKNRSYSPETIPWYNSYR
jgi:hypothetical protein